MLPSQSSIPARPASIQLPAAVLPSRVSSAAGEASVSVVSPALGPSGIPGGFSTLGAASSNSVMSTFTVSKGEASVSETSQPSAVYTGLTANNGVMNRGTSTSLLLLAIGTLLLL